jgi:hypothetical protein
MSRPDEQNDIHQANGRAADLQVSQPAISFCPFAVIHHFWF